MGNPTMYYMSFNILGLALISCSFAAISGPTKCELSIVRCCDTENNRILPLRCFEVNGCPGLYWYGKKACSKNLVASAKALLNKSSKDPKKEVTPRKPAKEKE